jgi:hypothetical protein
MANEITNNLYGEQLVQNLPLFNCGPQMLLHLCVVEHLNIKSINLSSLLTL